MVVATPSAGMSYYFGPWEPFIAGDFLAHLRSAFKIDASRESTAIAGISMGGYGALKIAFGAAGCIRRGGGDSTPARTGVA